MNFIDLTGKQTLTLVGNAPTLHATGGPGGGPYFGFDSTGCYDIAGNSSDFIPGMGPYCVELVIYVYGDSNAVDFSSGSTDTTLLSTAGGAITSDRKLNVSGFKNHQTMFNTNPPWDDPTYQNSWVKVRMDVSAGGLADIYINGVLKQSGVALVSPGLSVYGGPFRLLGTPGFNGYYSKAKIAGLRLTKAARGTSEFDLSKTGVDDAFWASTVLAISAKLPVPDSYNITDVTETFSSGTGRITYGGASPRIVSGTLGKALSVGESLQISVDNGATWAVAAVSGTAWSYTDNAAHVASWVIQIRATNTSGEFGPVVSLPITYRTWPSLSITSMEKDDGTVGDWATSNGSAPRTVYGGTAAALIPDEVIQVSFDNGANWALATVSGQGWAAQDLQFHTTSWTIQARVANPSAGISAPEVSVDVTLIPPQPTVLPRGTYTTLLDIIRRFMERTGLPKPAFSIGNTDTQVAQILGLLEEATEEIVMRNARGWQILNRQAIFQTKAQEIQGSLSELAPGFRAVINDTLFNRTTRLPIYGPLLPMERQATKALQTAGPYYRYWIANDELHFYPIPPAGQTIAFEYTSTAAWSDGKTPATYSEYPDSDTAICLFPKPVMIAQLRWRWKKEKGLEYAEDFAMAERLLNAAIAADGTRRVVDLGGTELVARPGIMIPTGSWPIK